jgi:hypothetical protein
LLCYLDGSHPRATLPGGENDCQKPDPTLGQCLTRLANRATRRHHGARPRGSVPDSQIEPVKQYRRHGACPRGATTAGQADNRGPTGTSPVTAIDWIRASSGYQSPVPRGRAPWCRVQQITHGDIGAVFSPTSRCALRKKKEIFFACAVRSRWQILFSSKDPLRCVPREWLDTSIVCLSGT